MNVAVVALAPTLTDVGSASDVLLSESATERPPLPAAWVNVTVQVVLPPDVIVDGAHCRAETAIVGVTVIDAVAELARRVAVTVAV